jgi:hypothetical protein
MIEYKHHAQKPVCLLDDKIQTPCAETSLLIRRYNTNTMHRHLSAYWLIEYKQHAQKRVCFAGDPVHAHEDEAGEEGRLGRLDPCRPCLYLSRLQLPQVNDSLKCTTA